MQQCQCVILNPQYVHLKWSQISKTVRAHIALALSTGKGKLIKRSRLRSNFIKLTHINQDHLSISENNKQHSFRKQALGSSLDN